MDSWETTVNLCMKHRDSEAVKRELTLSRTKIGNGTWGMRSVLAYHLGQMCPVHSRSLKVLFNVHDKKLREASTQRDLLRGGRHRDEANAPGNAGDRVHT